MASQFPRNELFHVTMLQEMNNLKNRQDDAKELIKVKIHPRDNSLKIGNNLVGLYEH